MIVSQCFVHTMISLPLPIYRIVYKYIYDTVTAQLLKCYYSLNLKSNLPSNDCDRVRNDSYRPLLASYNRAWKFYRFNRIIGLSMNSLPPMYVYQDYYYYNAS